MKRKATTSPQFFPRTISSEKCDFGSTTLSTDRDSIPFGIKFQISANGEVFPQDRDQLRQDLWEFHRQWLLADESRIFTIGWNHGSLVLGGGVIQFEAFDARFANVDNPVFSDSRTSVDSPLRAVA